MIDKLLNGFDNEMEKTAGFSTRKFNDIIRRMMAKKPNDPKHIGKIHDRLEKMYFRRMEGTRSTTRLGNLRKEGLTRIGNPEGLDREIKNIKQIRKALKVVDKGFK